MVRGFERSRSDDDLLAVDVGVALESIRAAVLESVNEIPTRAVLSLVRSYKIGSLPKIMCHEYSIILEVTSSGRSLFNTQSYMRL